MNSNPARQSGAALIFALLILVVITIVAVVAAQGSVMQERMSSNYREGSLAFEAAEAANRWGESWTQGRTALQRPWPCASGCLPSDDEVYDAGVLPDVTDPTFDWTAVGIELGSDGANPIADFGPVMAGLSENPEFYIEQIARQPDDLGTTGVPTEVVYYRITARGSGARATNTGERIVESTAAKRY